MKGIEPSYAVWEVAILPLSVFTHVLTADTVVNRIMKTYIQTPGQCELPWKALGIGLDGEGAENNRVELSGNNAGRQRRGCCWCTDGQGEQQARERIATHP